MTLEAKVLWLAFAILGGAFLALAITSCAEQQKKEAAALTAEALTCRGKLSAVIQAAPSCGVAAAGVRQLIKEDPSCVDVFLGHGLEMTCGDGGPK